MRVERKAACRIVWQVFRMRTYSAEERKRWVKMKLQAFKNHKGWADHVYAKSFALQLLNAHENRRERYLERIAEEILGDWQ